MLDLDALLIARIQFGFTISFHIVFPALTVGLASYLPVLEARWLMTGNQATPALGRASALDARTLAGGGRNPGHRGGPAEVWRSVGPSG